MNMSRWAWMWKLKCSTESQLIPFIDGALLAMEAEVDDEESIGGTIIHVRVRPINTADRTPTPVIIHFRDFLVIWRDRRYQQGHILSQVYGNSISSEWILPIQNESTVLR